MYVLRILLHICRRGGLRCLARDGKPRLGERGFYTKTTPRNASEARRHVCRPFACQTSRYGEGRSARKDVPSICSSRRPGGVGVRSAQHASALPWHSSTYGGPEYACMRSTGDADCRSALLSCTEYGVLRRFYSALRTEHSVPRWLGKASMAPFPAVSWTTTSAPPPYIGVLTTVDAPSLPAMSHTRPDNDCFGLYP